MFNMYFNDHHLQEKMLYLILMLPTMFLLATPTITHSGRDTHYSSHIHSEQTIQFQYSFLAHPKASSDVSSFITTGYII